MMFRLAKRMLTETDLRLLWKFAFTFGYKGMRAVQAFKRRVARGDLFPAFLFISITDRCNLSCQGCWVTPAKPSRELSVETLDNLIGECRTHGSSFFGLLGGEPLLHKGLFDVLGKHSDCYFQVFSNGTLVTDEVAKEMRRVGNVTPLISIEGLEKVSDVRRGGSNVYGRATEALEHCRANRLVFGVATSICASNIEDLVSETFVDDMIARGAHYLWYYIYRPVGPHPTPELALSAEQVRRLRRFIVDVRLKKPIAIVDAYWDHEGKALCPAATGISHHIGPGGDIEPCPPIQFACENVGDGKNLAETLRSSQFLQDFRETVSRETRGCVLLERPDVLADVVARAQARDSSGRETVHAELAALQPRPGHDMGEDAIPERNWFYRFAKKHWFFGFGAYG